MGASGSKVWEEPSVSTKGTMFTHARSDSADFWDSPSYLQPEPGVPIDLRQVSSPQRSGGILRNPFGTPRKKSFKDGDREGGGRASVVGSLVGGTLGTLGTLLHFKGASSNPSQKSSTEGWVPVYLHDRVLAFTYESDADRPAGPEDDRRYWRCLQEGAAFLATQHPDTVLLVNLGPSLLRPELYSLFGNNVCELGTTWGSPPGAAICALDSLFAACASINNWLALDDENVAVLHTRSNFGSRPGTFLRFVAACYLTFSSEFDHCLEAMSSLPRAWEDNYPRFAAGPNGRGSFDSRESEEKGLSRGAASAATAAQRRYCQYFGDVLYAQSVPLRRKGAISLNKVILGACPAVDGTDGCRPYIRVFRRGVEIGSTLKKSEIPARHEASTNWMVPFQLDVPVWGDVSFTVHNWTGNTRKDDACPLFVFSFHTGFIDTGLVRITRRQLDCAYDGEMVIPDEFFIDITLDPSAVNFAVNLEKKQRGDSWSEDMDALAGENVDDHNWKGMLASSYGFEYEESAARENETQQRRFFAVIFTTSCS